MTNHLANLSNSNFDYKIKEYFQYRSAQLALLGYEFDYEYGYDIQNKTVTVRYTRHGHVFYAIYIREQFRGWGAYMERLQEIRDNRLNTEFRIVTFDECGITPFLEAKNIAHVSHAIPQAFAIIEKVYGDTKSNRNDILYINHIVKGLLMYQKVFASIDELNTSMQVYCLHPIFQVDEYTEHIKTAEMYCSVEVCEMSREYRITANSYLSKDYKSDDDEPKLSYFIPTNRALLIDKIQNYTSLLNNFGNSHPNHENLVRYFMVWIKLLTNEYNLSMSAITDLIVEEVEDWKKVSTNSLGNYLDEQQ